MIDLIFLLYYKIIMPSIHDFNSDHLIGKRLGTCTILKELARGGMGIVFIAYQQTFKRQIALKLISKNYFKSQVAERFQHEAEVAAILPILICPDLQDWGNRRISFFYDAAG